MRPSFLYGQPIGFGPYTAGYRYSPHLFRDQGVCPGPAAGDAVNALHRLAGLFAFFFNKDTVFLMEYGVFMDHLTRVYSKTSLRRCQAPLK